MSSATGAQFGSATAARSTEWRGPWEWDQRRCGGSMRWRPLELVAMVLGFMVFWPIGLAILGWKMCMKSWNRQSGDFGEYLDNLRRARDREEFDSFMSQRRRPPSSEPPQPSPAV